jgi:hypothetical protein
MIAAGSLLGVVIWRRDHLPAKVYFRVRVFCKVLVAEVGSLRLIAACLPRHINQVSTPTASLWLLQRWRCGAKQIARRGWA